MSKFLIKIAIAMSFFLIGITTNAATVETNVARITNSTPDVTTGQTGDITHEYPADNVGPCTPNGGNCIIGKSSVMIGLAGISKISANSYVFTFQVTSVTYLYLTGDADKDKEVTFDGNNVKLPNGLKVHIDECELYPELVGKEIPIGEVTTNSSGYFTIQIHFNVE